MSDDQHDVGRNAATHATATAARRYSPSGRSKVSRRRPQPQPVPLVLRTVPTAGQHGRVVALIDRVRPAGGPPGSLARLRRSEEEEVEEVGGWVALGPFEVDVRPVSGAISDMRQNATSALGTVELSAVSTRCAESSLTLSVQTPALSGPLSMVTAFRLNALSAANGDCGNETVTEFVDDLNGRRNGQDLWIGVAPCGFLAPPC